MGSDNVFMSKFQGLEIRRKHSSSPIFQTIFPIGIQTSLVTKPHPSFQECLISCFSKGTRPSLMGVGESRGQEARYTD